MYEEDYEDEEAVAKEEMANQVDETLTFTIPLNYNMENYIKAAVTGVVERQVKQAVAQQVEQAVAKEINKAISKIITDAVKTPVKTFDYAGNVTDERSLQDIVTKAIQDVAKDGLGYKLPTTDRYDRNEKTISTIIKEDIYAMIKDRLKPQFDEIEKDFKSKSQEALRAFAIAAVDTATQKTLQGR